MLETHRVKRVLFLVHRPRAVELRFAKRAVLRSCGARCKRQRRQCQRQQGRRACSCHHAAAPGCASWHNLPRKTLQNERWWLKLSRRQAPGLARML